MRVVRRDLPVEDRASRGLCAMLSSPAGIATCGLPDVRICLGLVVETDDVHDSAAVNGEDRNRRVLSPRSRGFSAPVTVMPTRRRSPNTSTSCTLPRTPAFRSRSYQVGLGCGSCSSNGELAALPTSRPG